MARIENLSTLMRSMKPKLRTGEIVFCTFAKEQYAKLNVKALMMFREKEGITLILEKKIADKQLIAYHDTWKIITLTVHSSLTAVGFLATITKSLAEQGISVNAVSAYFHDHLFVPAGKTKKALQILEELRFKFKFSKRNRPERKQILEEIRRNKNRQPNRFSHSSQLSILF